MKLPQWFFFYRPTIIQFQDGKYGVRVWKLREGLAFRFIDLTEGPHYSKVMYPKQDRFDRWAKTEDLDKAISVLATLMVQKEEIRKQKKQNKTNKKYTVITFAGDKN